ncbi:MAG: enoyl-CoA hydratase/isomerase family protein [Hyphomicrobiaceae bacterium]|nr:enoyl-CoA hydratase/isomerase family protein [Hyphomicrobiaceae bacterium]MCC0009844.1 enoyl-CoA hydratase/isomerase family protein [Hyphomicrobiaceae bacterium]
MPPSTASLVKKLSEIAGDELLFEVDEDGIGMATLNRPHARNALTLEMYEGLAGICGGIEPGGPVKALIVTGAGEKAFGAGTDIATFRNFSTRDDALNYESRMDAILTTIEKTPVPTIAAIAGACTGGGAAIAAVCDLRLCTGDMRFGFPIARTLGNCLSMNNLARLASLIGSARTKEILFTARLIEAGEAESIGLVTQVLPDHAALMGRAVEMARQLVSHAPLTLRATKEALRRLGDPNFDGGDEDLIAMCYTSNDFREGMEAFLAKTKPAWRGN